MLVVSTRRELVNAALFTPFMASSNYTNPSLLLVDIITNYVPRDFLQAVSKTGRFLYRGESSIKTFKVLAPQPDLLIPGTYDDSTALDYFQCLENRLKEREINAIPSKGHIATSDVKDASQWGEAVSIWPLGASFSFVWPKEGKFLFPPSTPCPDDELVINHDLETALRLGHEVLFASSLDVPKRLPGHVGDLPNSSFLAVSPSMEDELRAHMQLPGLT